jgi:hypothetical protein
MRTRDDIAELLPSASVGHGLEAYLVEAGAKAFASPSTIARKPAVRLSRSPAAMIASNIAGSSALSLSGRLSVTSATPSVMSIVTRSSDVVRLVPAWLAPEFPTHVASRRSSSRGAERRGDLRRQPYPWSFLRSMTAQ